MPEIGLKTAHTFSQMRRLAHRTVIEAIIPPHMNPKIKIIDVKCLTPTINSFTMASATFFARDCIEPSP